MSEPLVRADTGALIENPADAICVGTEVTDDGQRELPRRVFVGEAPLACSFSESPGPVVEAPCWYLCDRGTVEIGGCAETDSGEDGVHGARLEPKAQVVPPAGVS